MNPRNRLLFLILLTLVFTVALVALTVLFRTELREEVVLPLQAWWQTLRQNWLGLDADLRWSVFIILLAALLFISFPSPNRFWERKGSPVVENSEGRLAFWATELRILLGRGHITRFSIFELRRLALEVVGFRQQLSSEEAENWLQIQLKVGDTEVPAALRLLVDKDALAPTETITAEAPNLKHFVGVLFGIVKEIPAPISMVTPEQIEAITHYLEKLLEVSDADRDNP